MKKTIKSYHMNIGGLYNPSLEGFTTVNKTFLKLRTIGKSIHL